MTICSFFAQCTTIPERLQADGTLHVQQVPAHKPPAEYNLYQLRAYGNPVMLAPRPMHRTSRAEAEGRKPMSSAATREAASCSTLYPFHSGFTTSPCSTSWWICGSGAQTRLMDRTV